MTTAAGNLPHDPEAEKGTLGSIILWPTLLPRIQNILEPKHFFRESNGQIYAAFAALDCPDEITLRDELLRRGQLDTVGGAAYIASLTDGIPSSTHGEYYARIVREKAILRDGLRRAQDFIDSILRRNGAAPGEQLEEIQSGARDWADSLSAEVLDAPALLVPVTAADWKPEETAVPEFGTLGGEVLVRRGDLSRVDGYVGEGKSFVVMAAAIARSQGLPLLGFPCTERGRAAYIGTEGEGKDIHAGRACRLLQGFERDKSELEGPWLRVFSPPRLNLDDPGHFDELRRFLDSFDPAFVGIACYATICGPHRNRNDESDTADFFATRLRPLQVRPDGSRRTLLIEGHMRKVSDTRGGNHGRNDALQRVSSSYYATGGADASIAIEGRGPERFFAKCGKRSRSGLTFSPFLGHILGDPPDGPITLVNEGGPRKTAVDLGDHENRFLEAISALAPLKAPGAWFSVAEVCRQASVEHSNAKAYKAMTRAAKSLASRGRLEAHREVGGKYRLPLPEEGDLFEPGSHDE